MTTEFDYEDMTDEELAEICWRQAIENARVVLDLAERCREKFGKQLLTNAQEECFEKLALGGPLCDEELVLCNVNF